MSWLPLRLELAGADRAAAAAEVTITRGREDTDTQPRAGRCRVVLIDPPRDLAAVDPFTELRVVAEVAGAEVVLFTGQLGPVATAIAASGQVGERLQVTLEGDGPLGRVHRGIVREDGYGQQLDGDRIAAVLEDALGGSRWRNIDGTLTWAAVDPADTWATLEGDPVELIDPGQYVLEADRASDDPWRIIRQAAQDGGGVLYETADGRIGYGDSTRRITAAQQRGFTRLPDELLLREGLQSATTVGELVTDAEVTYSTGTVRHRDPDAVRRYGAVLTRRVSTRLLEQAAAEDRARVIVRHGARPSRDLDRLEIDLGLADDDQLEQLLGLEIGEPLEVVGLPPLLTGSSRWSGFIEHLELTITPLGGLLDLTVSAYERSTYGGRWIDLPDGLAWTDTDPAIDWLNAEELIL